MGATPIEAMVAAVHEYHGNVMKAAQSLGMNDSSFYSRAKKSKVLKRAIVEARSKRNDNVVDALYDNAMSGNVTAQIFIAKTQVPGFQENMTHDGELVIRVKYADD